MFIQTPFQLSDTSEHMLSEKIKLHADLYNDSENHIPEKNIQVIIERIKTVCAEVFKAASLKASEKVLLTAIRDLRMTEDQYNLFEQILKEIFNIQLYQLCKIHLKDHDALDSRMDDVMPYFPGRRNIYRCAITWEYENSFIYPK